MSTRKDAVLISSHIASVLQSVLPAAPFAVAYLASTVFCTKRLPATLRATALAVTILAMVPVSMRLLNVTLFLVTIVVAPFTWRLVVFEAPLRLWRAFLAFPRVAIAASRLLLEAKQEMRRSRNPR